MIKKTIKSVDFDGNERCEDYYFHISKNEIAKAQMSVDGGLITKLQRIVNSQSQPEIAKIFEEFIDMSYGIKSDDGKKFMKSPEILADFKATAAYDELYMEILSDTKKAVEFINGVWPAEMTEKLKNDPKYLELMAKVNDSN